MAIIIDSTSYDLPADEFQAQKVTAYNAVFNALNVAWTAYVPTVASGTGTITTVGTKTARFRRIGKLIFFQADVTITTDGTADTNIQIGLPVTAAAFASNVNGVENAISGKLLRCAILASGAVVIVTNYDNTYPSGDGARFIISGVYEAA